MNRHGAANAGRGEMGYLQLTDDDRSSIPAAPKTVQLFALLFELGLLAAFAYWGWHLGGGGTRRVAVAAAIPIGAVVLWVLFAAPGLSGRRTQAMIQTPGWLRLAIEFGLIGLAAYGVWAAGSRAAGETLLTAAGLLLAVSWEPALRIVRH